MNTKVAAFQAIVAVAIALSGCNAFSQSVVLKADSPNETLTLKNGPAGVGGEKTYSYVFAVSTAECKLNASGTAKFFRKTDGMTDSTYLPDGDNVKTNQFIDKNDIGDVIITLDVESKHPKYASVMVSNPKPRTDSCFKVKDASYLFYGR